MFINILTSRILKFGDGEQGNVSGWRAVWHSLKPGTHMHVHYANHAYTHKHTYACTRTHAHAHTRPVLIPVTVSWSILWNRGRNFITDEYSEA